jgi:hypothetical protein
MPMPPNRFPGQRQVRMPMRPGFRGFGACAAQAPANQPGVTGGVTGPVPPNMGGNAVQGQGIDFTYATASLTVNHGTTSSATPIQFDANSVFVWLRSTFQVTIAEAAFTYSAIPVPNIYVSIQDTGKGASFMNTGVPIWTIASNIPGLPFVLPIPQLIQANASFSWTFQNIDAAVNYADVQFQLHGFRVFNPNITDLSQIFPMSP